MGNQSGLINAYDPGLSRIVEVICGDLLSAVIDAAILAISMQEDY